MTTSVGYPARVYASLDPMLSRWRWLIKWALLIPHYIVLAFLWIALILLTVAAFFAILFTGRYPRAIFNFNLGVLRWTWRVQCYGYGALATDRYPPFTTSDVPDYPAHLAVDYPEHLSRGLVLVKWWLLAIPHYIVLGFFLSGSTWVAWQAGDQQYSKGPGLIGFLAVVAGVILAVSRSYPKPLFELLMGLNRWVFRVAAYAILMTDEYPPFRLDMGGQDPSGAGTIADAGGPLEAEPPTKG